MKDFAPYKEALAVIELGFNEPCLGWYVSEDYGLEIGKAIQSDLIKDGIVAPTFSQCFRFFREKYDWQHSIDPTADQHSHQLGYNYWIWNYKTGEEHWTMPKNRPTGDWEYETYEQAELECLRKLIGIVKNK